MYTHTHGAQQKLRQIPRAEIFALNVLYFCVKYKRQQQRFRFHVMPSSWYFVRVAKNTFLCFVKKNIARNACLVE